MPKKKVLYELDDSLSEDLCRKALVTRYKKVNRKRRIPYIILFGFFASVVLFLEGTIAVSVLFLGNPGSLLLYEIFAVMVFILIFVCIAACPVYALYFFHHKQIERADAKLGQRMSASLQRHVVLYTDRVEEITPQTVQRFSYEKIDRIVNTKNAIVLEMNNALIIISKKSMGTGMKDMWSFLRTVSKAKYYA